MPIGVGGIALTTLGLAAIVATLGISTQTSESPAEAVALAVVFAIPFSIVVRAGHLGRSNWRVPTPGAFVFVIWQLGLAPSMVSVNAESLRVAFFSSEAVSVGRTVFFAWFLAYALALGRAPLSSADRDATGTAERPRGIAIGFIVLLGLWALVGMYAIRYNLVSAWGSSSQFNLAAGSVEVSAGMVYGLLTIVMIPVALLVRLTGGVALRIPANGLMIVGAVALFIYSQRRLWVFVIYLCLNILYLCRGPIKLRWIVVAVSIGVVGVGPLVWVYRGFRQTTGMSSDAPQEALRAVVDYATNEDARADANLAGTGNLTERLNISVALFGATEHVLRSGANWSPSFLEPLVRSVPTVVWPDKNNVANSLSARAQLLKTGRFPETDLAVSPVTELIFEIGVLLAPLGGALYGVIGRFAAALSSAAMRSLPIFVIWVSFIINLSYFDSGTNALMNMREPFGIALILEAMIRIFAADRSRSTKMHMS